MVFFPFGSGDEGAVTRGLTHLAEHGIISWSRGTGERPAVEELSSLEVFQKNGVTSHGRMHLVASGDHAATPRLLWLASRWLHGELLYGEREFNIELDAVDNEYVQQPRLARSYVPPYGEAAEAFVNRWNKTTTMASRAEARSLGPEEVERHIERLRALDGIFIEIRSPHDADTLTNSIRSIFPDARIVARADDDESTLRRRTINCIPDSALAAAPTFTVLAPRDTPSSSAVANPVVERVTRFIDLDLTRPAPNQWRLALTCAFAAEQACEKADSCQVGGPARPVAKVATVAAGTGAVVIDFSPPIPLSEVITRLDAGKTNAERILSCMNDEVSKSKAELDFDRRLRVAAPAPAGSTSAAEPRLDRDAPPPPTLEDVVHVLSRFSDLDVLRESTRDDVQPPAARASAAPTPTPLTDPARAP